MHACVIPSIHPFRLFHCFTKLVWLYVGQGHVADVGGRSLGVDMFRAVAVHFVDELDQREPDLVQGRAHRARTGWE